MQVNSGTLFDLEQKFWQSIVDEDADTAIGLLTEPVFMVSSRGVSKFDHAGYRRMADQGCIVVKSYELSEMDASFPSEDIAILTYKVKQVWCQRGNSEEVTKEMKDTSRWVRNQGEV